MVDKIAKLLRKASAKDRQRLDELLELLISGKTQGLKIEKIKASDLYRVRVGRFRVIFHYDAKRVVIDSVRLRNEETYKNL